MHELSHIRDTSPKNFESITLGEWLDLCLEIYMKNSLKQSTYLSYESYIRVHLKPALGSLQLRDLTPRLLQQYYNYKAEEGLSLKTIININLFLHKALSYAVTEGYIPSNPIVIQPPKSQNSIRSIPLLPAVIQDLMNWKNIQRGDQAAAGDQYQNSGMIVTNPFGGYIEPRTFSDQYHQILALAGLRHFTFHALRHTFASRAMEQGMDVKTLSVILGHYSVAFTMDTYAHVLTDHKRESMALMEDLYGTGQTVMQEVAYPVIVTSQADGTMLFEVPDFPEIQFSGADMPSGLQYVKERLQEERLISVFPPAPAPLSQIIPQPGQFLLQIPV